MLSITSDDESVDDYGKVSSDASVDECSDISEDESVDECEQWLGAMHLQQPATELPPRASFLGLPVELRLHIYSFITGAPPTTSRHFNNYSSRNSCCGQAITDFAILVVSKQTRAEAKSIIWQTFELSVAYWDLRRSAVPGRVRRRVRNLFVLCDAVLGVWRYDCAHEYREPLKSLTSLWSGVRMNFPNVRQVRLRIDHAGLESICCGLGYGIMEITDLQKVIVESYIDTEEGQKSRRAKMLFESIKADLEWPENDIEVVETFLLGPQPEPDAREGSPVRSPAPSEGSDSASESES